MLSVKKKTGIPEENVECDEHGVLCATGDVNWIQFMCFRADS